GGLRHRDPGRDRAHERDRSVLGQRLQRALDRQHVRDELAFQSVPQRLRGHIANAGHAPVGRDTDHEMVHGSRMREERREAGFAGGVDGRAGGRPGHPGQGPVEPLAAPSPDHDVVAIRREPAGGGEADPGRASNDRSSLAISSHHASILLRGRVPYKGGMFTAGPGRPRSERARRAILDAALDIAEAQGYGAVTIKGIAQAANVGRQTVYRWWPNAAYVLLEALFERGEREAAPV